MISIIMPLFNAERFLEETLQSVAKQTYTQYELICIDDASEDATADIVRNRQEQDKRIKLLYNEIRQGAAYSRNKGLAVAKGEYIAFLDGDDIFEEEMLEKAYKCATQNELDIVVFESKHVDSDKIYQKQFVNRGKRFEERYCRKPFSLSSLKAEEYCIWSSSPWDKLFRAKFIWDNDLQFQPLQSSNDVYFVELAYLLAERMMHLNDNRVMVYARDHDTPTRISFDRDPMCTFYACCQILEEISNRQLIEKLYEHCYLKCLFMLLGAFVKTKTEKKRKEYYRFLQTEGIDVIKGKSEYYSLLNDRIKNGYQSFIKEDYSSQCYKRMNLMSYLLQDNENRNRIQELFTKYNHILIWGAGNYGHKLAENLSEMQLDAYGVVDINEGLVKQKIGKYIIWGKNDVDFHQIDLVIVAAEGAFDDVKAELEVYSLEVLDLCEIVGL